MTEDNTKYLPGEREYYNSLNPEEKRFYDSLSESDKKWLLEKSDSDIKNLEDKVERLGKNNEKLEQLKESVNSEIVKVENEIDLINYRFDIFGF